MCSLEGVVGFAGWGTVITWGDFEAMEGARRKALAKHGSTVTWPRAHVYTETSAGGEGNNHAYQTAAASWMSAIDNALAAPAGQTAGVLARNMVAATAWRLGCRGVSPLEWHPAHLEEQLNEDFLVEAWHLQRLRTNLRGIRTGAPVGDGLEDIKWRLDLKQEVRRGPRIWEHAAHVKWWAHAQPCRYARRLAGVGIVWWADVTHSNGGRWMTWAEAKRMYRELSSATDQNKYESLLEALEGQPAGVREEWFEGHREGWNHENSSHKYTQHSKGRAAQKPQMETRWGTKQIMSANGNTSIYYTLDAQA